MMRNARRSGLGGSCRRPSAVRFGLALICGAGIAGAPVRGDERNEAFFGRFVHHVAENESLDAEARKIILDALAERNADTDDMSLLIEALVLMSPGFREGLDAYDEEDYAACLAAMERIADADDPYVRENARAYAVKALVHSDRLIEAQQHIEDIVANFDTFTRHSLDGAEMRYMLGYCQVQNLEHEKARQTLEQFLEDYPDASPRFVVTAKQMLAELARRIPESIGEVADLMFFSEKRLSVGDSDERVQEAQEKAVALLDELIEQVEEQEQNQQASAGGQSQRSQRSPRQENQTEQPMEDSQQTQGRAHEGPKSPGRRVNPGEAWGTMPAAEREKILQVLRDRFPGRYRALVEQYYQSLAEQP